MTNTLENVPAADVSEMLLKQGVYPDKPVTIIVDESLPELAARSRAYAEKRGLTATKLQELLKE